MKTFLLRVFTWWNGQTFGTQLWTALYGEQTVAAQKPLQAELKFNTWIVTGSTAPESALFVFMLQADGRVLSIGLGRPKT